MITATHIPTPVHPGIKMKLTAGNSSWHIFYRPNRHLGT